MKCGRPSSEPAPSGLGLSLAGRRFGFAFDTASFAAAMSRRYAAFLAPPPAGTVEVRAGGPVRPPFLPRVSGWPLISGRRGDFGFSFDAVSGSGRAVVSPRAQSFDSFLRTLCSALLNGSGGALVHACGLAVSGRAHVFIGRSGAGKSTLARLAAAAGAEVISDEIVPLRLERGRFYVHGSPFWGELRSAGRPLRLPLGGIYALRKSRINSLRAGPVAGFIPLFMRCSLNFSKEPAASSGLLDAAARAARLYKGAFSFSKKNASFLRLLK
ncbi:MAG: hypothetical protein RDU13_02125 [Elusimicrobiales bacterium]|nr:hypothetical protein [Elusimicrobiales bacterium]